MKWYSVILLGALGGMCPSIAKLAATYFTNPSTAPPVLGVYIALGLFALLGSIVALGFGAKEARAAIVAGIAAPAIVTNIVAGAEKKDNPVVVGEVPADNVGFSWLLGLVTPVMAQADTSEILGLGTNDNEPEPEYVNIAPVIVKGGTPLKGSLTYEWVDSEGVILNNSSKENIIDPGVLQSLPIPDGAQGLLINGILVQLPEEGMEHQMINLDIQTEPTFIGDLKWTFGAQRDYQVESIQVVPQVSQ